MPKNVNELQKVAHWLVHLGLNRNWQMLCVVRQLNDALANAERAPSVPSDMFDECTLPAVVNARSVWRHMDELYHMGALVSLHSSWDSSFHHTLPSHFAHIHFGAAC